MPPAKHDVEYPVPYILHRILTYYVCHSERNQGVTNSHKSHEGISVISVMLPITSGIKHGGTRRHDEEMGLFLPVRDPSFSTAPKPSLTSTTLCILKCPRSSPSFFPLHKFAIPPTPSQPKYQVCALEVVPGTSSLLHEDTMSGPSSFQA